MKIGIIGLGCIGGSLALALAGKKGISKICALDRDEQPIRMALACKAINEGTTKDYSIFSNCDILFIGVNTAEVLSEAEKAARVCKGIITDTASTKAGIMKAAARSGIPRFIGGHPMAGSERNGFSAAKATLFTDAAYVLCRGSASGDDMKMLQNIIRLTGAIPLEMDEEAHDRAAALASHLPHIQAAVLCALASSGGEDVAKMAAGGFRDMTRIASCDPGMWADILISNQKALNKALCDQVQTVREIQRLIRNGDKKGLIQFLSQAREYREKAIKPR